jgi:hypothetical protein
MQDRYQTYGSDTVLATASELIAERKQQIAHEQAALQAQKDQNLQKQTCVDTAPELRISLWEGRHGLALPRSPHHPLLPVIAASTDLDLEQVRSEQQRRARLRAGTTVR